MSIIKTQYQKNKIGWKKSFLDSFPQNDSGEFLPWMTYNFIEFISEKLNKNHEIFEYGLGSSTFFFAKKVKKVTVLESNKSWLLHMQIKLKNENLNNVEAILMTDALENVEYENYIKNSGKKYDIIIVDSLKRFECVKNSFEFLKKDGMLIVDDFERKSYKKISDFLEEKGFKRLDFIGIAPGGFKIKNTAVFVSH